MISKERLEEIRSYWNGFSNGDYVIRELLAALDETTAQLAEKGQEFVRMENAWRDRCRLAMYGETDTVVHPKLHAQVKEQLAASERARAKLRGALEYYANEKNWYDVNLNHPRAEKGSKIRMVIGSLDTEGHEWIGGRAARQALAADNALGPEGRDE